MKPIRALFQAILVVLPFFLGSGCGKKEQPVAHKSADAAKPAANIAGYWSGELKVPGNSFRLGFDVLPGAGAQRKGTMDSFDQGLRDWPITAIQEGNMVLLEVDLKQSGLAKFEGQLSEDGKEIEGTWRQGPATLPLTLTLGDKAAAIRKATAPPELSPAELEQTKAAATKLQGTWAGTLNAGGKELRLEFTVAANAGGTPRATMKSLDQGGAAVPVTKTLLDKNEVTFHIVGIQGKYVGTFDPDGNIIDGTWTQGPASLPLVLEKK